jgi:hypothetical protein
VTVISTEDSEAPSRGEEEGVEISDADLLAEFNVASSALSSLAAQKWNLGRVRTCAKQKPHYEERET